MFRKYPELFQDPHIQYPIDDLNLDFADYIAKNKSIIEKYRFDRAHGTALSTNLIIEANSPFELRPEKPAKYGVLLVHGLLDTPFIMKDIGMELQKQGLLVRSILLPGHATVPGALLNVTYEDWLQAVRYGIASFNGEVDHIFLGGFSTGAALAMYHTLLNPEKIAGILTFSPALRIHTTFDYLSHMPSIIGKFIPRVNWLHISQEPDYTKYQSMSFNAVYQLYSLIQALKKCLKETDLQCPLFMGLSYDDLIVTSQASINYFLSNKNPHNHMVLYTNNVELPIDSRMTLRRCLYPEWRIKSFCHISIPISPTNFHYGIYGDYPLASHVCNDDRIIYNSLDKPRKIVFDFLYKLKITPFVHERLTFNPDFDFMMEKVKEFVETCNEQSLASTKEVRLSE